MRKQTGVGIYPLTAAGRKNCQVCGKAGELLRKGIADGTS
jgi:hypothetical protein